MLAWVKETLGDEWADLLGLLQDRTAPIWGLAILGFTTLFSLGALGYSYFGANKVFLLGASALSTLFLHFLKRSGMEEIMKHRELPFEARVAATTAKSLDAAVTHAARLVEYIHDLLSRNLDREGAYAISHLLEDMLDPNLVQGLDQLMRDMVKLDHREEMVRRIGHRYEQRLRAIRLQFTHELDTKEMAARKKEFLFNRAKMAFRRTLWHYWLLLPARGGHEWSVFLTRLNLWQMRAIWRDWPVRVTWCKRHKAKKTMLKAKKSYLLAIRRRNKTIKHVHERYDFVFKSYNEWLHAFEARHLVKAIPVARADWGSARLTILTNRVVEKLLKVFSNSGVDVHSPTAEKVRQAMKLKHLPWNAEAFETFVYQYVGGRVALRPTARFPDAFEAFLRLYYLDLGPEKCPNMGPLGSQGFYDWVTRLVDAECTDKYSRILPKENHLAPPPSPPLVRKRRLRLR